MIAVAATRVSTPTTSPKRYSGCFARALDDLLLLVAVVGTGAHYIQTVVSSTSVTGFEPTTELTVHIVKQELTNQRCRVLNGINLDNAVLGTRFAPD